LVFVTKYRAGFLDDHAIDFLRGSFTKTCADFGATLVECDGEADHVHMLVDYPPTVQISKLVNSLKGVSSRMLSKDRPDLKKYNTKAMWSPSYFAASCGGAPLSKIADYVRNQRS
jgi:putative transposase